MKILCRLYKHIAAPSHLTISGLPFSRCRRCGVHMIQWRLDWIPIPRGKRLLWETPGPGGQREAGKEVPVLPLVSSVHVTSLTPRASGRRLFTLGTARRHCAGIAAVLAKFLAGWLPARMAGLTEGIAASVAPNPSGFSTGGDVSEVQRLR